MMQAGKDYGVEVVTAYEQRRVGQVFFPPGMLREALVRRGFVKRLSAPQADLLGDVAMSGTETEDGDTAHGRKRSARSK